MQGGIFNLAENLEQYNINGWHVLRKVKNDSSTGGHFSVGYEVQHDDGRKGFLKALDYSKAFLNVSDSAKVLNEMTNAYIFERDLLEECREKNMRYVVRIIDAGGFDIGPEQLPDNVRVFYPHIDYIVLEIAEKSLRNIIDLSKSFDYAWALRSLHNIAVGISELHGSRIAHQDIKPSNVLVFEAEQRSKLGDVGRSSAMSRSAPHDTCNWAGDFNYSPFEQLYGELADDWMVRRFSCDMFMFGNLVMMYFNNVSLSSAVFRKLDPSQHPQNWKDGYQAVRPYIDAAVADCLEQFNKHIDPELRKELVEMVRQLCNPEVERRGDLTKAHLHAQQYSMQRYISRLDYWVKKYEYSYKQVVM